MDSKKAKQLFEKYKAGTCSDEELALLEQWYEIMPEEGILADHAEIEASKAQAWAALNSTRQSKTQVLWPRIAGIAAALAVIVFGVWFYTARHPDNSSSRTAGRDLTTDIAPGSNKATLTLADGRVINLSEAKTGVVVGKDLRYNDGSSLSRSDISPRGGERSMTLSTPRGGTYQITLADGTKVWLNAASSLTYSAALNERGVRRVRLEGEGYFEVAPAYTSLRGRRTKQPFIVESRGQTVEVLGTHFNISSYAYDAGVKTTLLEGSVQVTPLQEPNNKKLLKPGEQAIVAKQFLKIIPVDVEVATAWKNGKFLFRQEKLESILNRLAYWYDVEIVYLGKKPVMVMSGIIERKSKLATVLSIIESTRKVQFKIEGRKVFVMN